MKNNFKNMLVAGILTSVFMVGTVSAKSGLLVSDLAGGEGTPTCEQTDDLTGILMSDFAATAASAFTGLLVSDRAGLMLSDRAGLLISDLAGGTGESGCTDQK